MTKKPKAVKHSKASKHLHKGTHEESVKPLATLQANAVSLVKSHLSPGGTTGTTPVVSKGFDITQNEPD